MSCDHLKCGSLQKSALDQALILCDYLERTDPSALNLEFLETHREAMQQFARLAKDWSEGGSEKSCSTAKCGGCAHDICLPSQVSVESDTAKPSIHSPRA